MKQTISFNTTIDDADPHDMLAALQGLDAYKRSLENKFRKTFIYCHGCKDYVDRSLAYEEPVHSGSPVMMLKCCKCHSLWTFVD